MGFEHTTLRDIVECSNHWATKSNPIWIQLGFFPSFQYIIFTFAHLVLYTQKNIAFLIGQMLHKLNSLKRINYRGAP